MDDKLKALLGEMKAVIEETEFNLGKFVDKGNKSAAGRVRKQMQALKKLAQEVRVEIMSRVKEAKE
jgi:hypothetical protein